MPKKSKSKTKTRSTATSTKTENGRHGSIAHTGNKCIGEVCYNEETNEVEVHLDDPDCPTDVIKQIVEGIVTGARTSIHLPQFYEDDDDDE